MKSLIAFIFVSILIVACNDDKVAEICSPKSLRINSGNDSIAYRYSNDRRLTVVEKYRGNTLTMIVDLAYRNGNLVTLTRTRIGLSGGDPYIDLIHTIKYGTDGMPSKLIEIAPFQPDAKTVTDFTHNSNKQLIRAVTTFQFPTFPENAHLGGYVYEYNQDGNVTTVKYLIRDELDNIEEVVARENLTFDDHATFYAESKDLTTLYVYVYRHIPNVNNNLSARIAYMSYNSYYKPPVDFEFQLTYDDGGRVTDISTENIYLPPSFGDYLFSKGRYACF